jgi:hypothetical protein
MIMPRRLQRGAVGTGGRLQLGLTPHDEVEGNSADGT